MFYAVFWLLQDFLQVFFAGNIIIPEYFLLLLLYLVLSRDREFLVFLWIAFAGGILWDLRWTGRIGFTAGVYVSAIIIARWFWSFMPDLGKNGPVIFFFMWFPTILVTFARIVVWGTGTTGLTGSLLVQQILILPVILFFAVRFSRKMASDNV